MNDRLVFYRDARDEFRWRFVASNGRLLANSGEGYKNHEDTVHGAALALAFSQADLERAQMVQASSGEGLTLHYDERKRGVTVEFTW